MKQDRLDALKQIKKAAQGKHKGKKFTTLSTKDKDALLETLCRMMGLIE